MNAWTNDLGVINRVRSSSHVFWSTYAGDNRSRDFGSKVLWDHEQASDKLHEKLPQNGAIGTPNCFLGNYASVF